VIVTHNRIYEFYGRGGGGSRKLYWFQRQHKFPTILASVRNLRPVNLLGHPWNVHRIQPDLLPGLLNKHDDGNMPQLVVTFNPSSDWLN